MLRGLEVILRLSPLRNICSFPLCVVENRLYFPGSWRTEQTECVCATYHSPIPISIDFQGVALLNPKSQSHF